MPKNSGQVKKKSLAINVLRGIGIAGMVVVAATSPFFGIRVIKGLVRYYKKRKWRDVYHAIRYLNKRGYVKILGETNDGRLKVEITKSGKGIVKLCEIDELCLDKSQLWDGKWRIIIFDIPVSKNRNRLAFTEKLKELGFEMIQKSVWICPYKCEEQVCILRKFYGIEKFTTIITSDDIEDEYRWRRIFNLKEIKGHEA